MMGWPFPWWGGMAGWLAMGLVVLVPLILIVLGVLLVVWLVNAGRGSATGSGGFMPPTAGPMTTQRTPLDIARERYARGEITREEFERLKQDLGG